MLRVASAAVSSSWTTSCWHAIEFSAHARDMTLPDNWSFTPANVLGRILLQEMAGNTSGACMQTLRE